jgi:lipid-A-disaccharide synthase
MIHYFIFAGEASGDLHGSRLMEALKKSNECTFTGVGGPHMRSQKMNSILNMEDFLVMGFTDVIKSFPKLYKQFYRVRDAILKQNPDCVILIDYPGFNLRLAKALRRKKYKGKIVQYVCPTVWAHGKSRIENMSNTLDLLLTIFPFEAAFFAHTPLRVRYVGNPLVENIQNHQYQNDWSKKVGLSSTENMISIFPGSRPAEIQSNAALQLEIAEEIKKSHSQTSFAISCAHENLKKPLLTLIEKSSLKLNKDIFLIPSEYSYELMRDSLLSLAKSGTVTLELALHHKPSVVIYKLSKLNYYIAKYYLRLRLPFYCIVNIVMQKEIFPEFIGKGLKSHPLFQKADEILKDPVKREDIILDCHALQHRLGRMSTNQTAAKAIEELLEC